MRPPTPRPLRLSVAPSLLARRAVIDVAAVVIAILLVHATLTTMGAAGELVIMVGKVVRPLTWPAARVVGHGAHLPVADLMTIVATVLGAAVAVGVIAGYAAEARRNEASRERR